MAWVQLCTRPLRLQPNSVFRSTMRSGLMNYTATPPLHLSTMPYRLVLDLATLPPSPLLLTPA